MAINDFTTCIRTDYQLSCPTTKAFGTTEYVYIYIQMWLNDFAITIVFAVAFCFLKNRL